MRAHGPTLLLALLPFLAAFRWPNATALPRATADDFVHDVLPLLQREGCASAYCHGAATGQGGFKLSLFGSDARADHASITRALGGRRVDLNDPDASLVLAKPMRALAHGGGKRFAPGSDTHLRLRAWIAAAAPFEATPPRRLQSLTLSCADQQLAVAAALVAGDDANTVDVTALATFASSDAGIATVDRAGRVTSVGDGEVFLFARYAGTSTRLAVLRPFAEATRLAGDAAHPLDAVFDARLRELGLAPAPSAAPERLARRLYFDLVDRPPTPFELRRFLALPASERVARTADALLQSPAFTESATRRVLQWFEVTEPEAMAPERRVLRPMQRRVSEQLAADAPLPTLTAALLARDGAYLTRHQDPRDRAELVGRAMLGVRIGCARCHDHPDDRWRKRDHLAFAACFATAADAADAQAEMTSSLYDEVTGQPIAPRLLPLPSTAAPLDLHAFVHDPAHDLFARALTNRVFAWLLGRGLVEPLDDHRNTNPGKHEAWLRALQGVFHAHGDRLRPLVRCIVTSRLYQLDARAEAAEDNDHAAQRTRWFAQRVSKPLEGVVLQRAMAAVLGVDVEVLGRLPESPLARRLAMVNGDGLAAALLRPGNAIDALTELGGQPDELRDELFLHCLTRLPTDAERRALPPTTALRDLAQALLLSREFEFLR